MIRDRDQATRRAPAVPRWRAGSSLLLTLVLALSCVAACADQEGPPSRIQPPDLVEEQARVRVDVVSVRTGDLFVPIRATGTVTPIRESRVSARVSGRLIRMVPEEGDFVEAGATLAEIERKDYALSRDSAAAQLEAGRAALDEARLNRDHLAREKERIERLYEREAVSRQRYDELATAYATTLARIASLTAQIRSAEASLELAERQLQDTVVQAPFAGYVATTMANEGEIISPGMPLVWLIDVDPVRTVVRIPEVEISRVFRGLPVEITFDALPGQAFGGEISEINAAVDPVSRNLSVKIDIANRDHRIRPGMFSRVTIKTDALTDVVVVPESALVSDREGNPAVFILDDGRARLRRVAPGIRPAGLVEVREGLSPGEQVLVSGNFGLADDTEVWFRKVEY